MTTERQGGDVSDIKVGDFFWTATVDDADSKAVKHLCVGRDDKVLWGILVPWNPFAGAPRPFAHVPHRVFSSRMSACEYIAKELRDSCEYRVQRIMEEEPDEQARKITEAGGVA